MLPDHEHTSRQYEQDLQELRRKVLVIGGHVERMVALAVQALIERDADLARAQIAADHEVNALEMEIDELCVRLLALRQPAASDLRFITTAMKIVTDLERMGDEAVNIAERALDLAPYPPVKPYVDLPRLASTAQAMVKDSLDAFVRRDAALAHDVLQRDELVDNLNRQIFRELLTYMLEDAQTISRATSLIFVAKYLERVADHATNVAEMVIFLVQGRDVRHAGKVRPLASS